MLDRNSIRRRGRQNTDGVYAQANFIETPALGDGLTLSRSAGSVYYFNGSGVLTATGDNVAAFTSNGLFIEGQATNIVLATEYRDASVWTATNNAMGATTPTLIDGSTPASGKNEVVEDTTVTAQHRKRITFTASAAGKYTLCFFAKRNVGTRSLQIVCENSTDGNWVNIRTDLAASPTITNNTTSNFATVELINGWTQVIVTGTIVTTGSQTINFYTHNGTTNTYTGDGASSIIYDWITLVNSGRPQSPIQGAATRYTSFISRPWIGAVSNFWLYVDFIYSYSSDALSANVIYVATVHKNPTNYFFIRSSTGGTGILQVGTGNNGVAQTADITSFSIDRGDRCRAVVTYDSVNGLRCRASNNGGAAGTSVVATSKAAITEFASAASLYLGSFNGVVTSSANSSEYRDYKLGTGILTTAQMAAMVGI